MTAGPRTFHPRLPALFLLGVFVLAALLGTAGPANAHATLVSSDPAQGAVLPEPPERVRFTFSESVAAVPDGVQVFDAAGGDVPSSAAVADDELDVTFPDGLGEGTFIVVWRVVSEDGHPVSGSLSFSVGAPSAEVTQPTTGGAGPTEVPLLLKVLRWLGYVGLFTAVGLCAFAAVVLPRSELGDVAGSRVLRVARYGCVLTALAWFGALPVTALYQVGGDVGSLARATTWSTLTPTEYAVTLAVVVGSVLAVVLLGDGHPSPRRRLAAAAVGGAAICAPALTGHTRATSPELLAVAADMLHLAAGSFWFGGLLGLALVLPLLLAQGDVAAAVLARFSGLAAGVLVALVATGSVLAWRVVGSWSALVETTYGRLLLLKITVAAIAVLIGAWNRYALMPRMQDRARRGKPAAEAALVRRTTMVEAAALVGVLLLTGVLVDRSPEADAVAGPQDVRIAMLGALKVKASMSSLSTGPTTVTIETRDAAGEFVEGLEAPKAALSSAGMDLGPMELTNIGPGTYTGEAVIPSSGTWRLQVSLRLSEFENPVTVLEFEIAED
ncbi:copper resistance protein CopC [Nocardioides sp.]|uniref:copper resistance protein CopC n=1 Tax=Nocardioides sp. TaxID=35761 RepID=UPI002BED2631|nr:copper resistance protein CopC [Nocardioides sp.]HXH79953.1 copper resistance protein CopC [Nocardioides sp.]